MRRQPTGLILCGGNAERLGGIDKPLRHLGERPLVDHVIARLRPQVAQIIISANRSRDRYAGLGFAVVDDATYAGCGPLAGFMAALATVDEPLLCVPGDAPAIPADLGVRLDAAPSRAAIVYAHDGRGAQPLCCLLRTHRHRYLHDDLRAYLDSGGSTPREWFARHHSVAVDFSELPLGAWSINTPDEWAAAEARLESEIPSRTDSP